jgi:hypothetical protein
LSNAIVIFSCNKLELEVGIRRKMPPLPASNISVPVPFSHSSWSRWPIRLSAKKNRKLNKLDYIKNKIWTWLKQWLSQSKPNRVEVEWPKSRGRRSLPKRRQMWPKRDDENVRPERSPTVHKWQQRVLKLKFENWGGNIWNKVWEIFLPEHAK